MTQTFLSSHVSFQVVTTKTRKLMKEREREKMNRLLELGVQNLILLKAGEFVGIGDTSSCFECVIKLFQKISGKYKKMPHFRGNADPVSHVSAIKCNGGNFNVILFCLASK